MIYVTGDIHGGKHVAKLGAFTKKKIFIGYDYVIICGDFGVLWKPGEELYWLNWINKKPWTTLWVDGNHENFDMLKGYPVVEFCGGKAHKITDKIYHLMRGEVFTIEDKTFFALGGAESHDRECRTENVTWWAGEMPSDDEYDNAVRNLEKHNWSVDYIISHCCASSVQDVIAKDKGYNKYPHNRLTDFFENVILERCRFNKWFFGHYHDNIDMDGEFIGLFNCIYDLQEEKLVELS